jgi:hypothetical protein
VRIRGREIPLPVLLWFGVVGSPAAWVLMFLTGFAFDLAQCNPAGREWRLPVDAWTIAATVFGVVVATLSLASAVATYRVVRDAGEEVPGSRIKFMAICGITIAPLFLAIILMSGLGATSLAECHQS